MTARVVLCHGPDTTQTAERLAAALSARGVRVLSFSSPADARDALDGCEALCALFDARGDERAWLDQALGIALARGVPVLAIARQPRGFVTEAQLVPRPRSERAMRELAERIRAALPATPRATVRSLAQSSEARWTRLVTEEVEAELVGRGWRKVALVEARDERARVFVEALPGDAWCKEVRGQRVWLRARVAPFNPVDLLHVRDRVAPRTYEWWILRDGRSDAWMRRVYRGASERISARTKFFGLRDAVLARSTPAGQLIDKRILTARVDRTGEIARELATLEEWLGRAEPQGSPGATPAPAAAPAASALQHLPGVGKEHVRAPKVGVPLGAG